MKKAKKCLWKTVMAVGFVIPVFLMSAVPDVNGTGPIQLLHFSGNVEIQASGQPSWERVSSPVTLKPGDVLRTGVRSQAEIVFNGGIVRMYENTLLKLPNIGMTVSGEPSNNAQQAFLNYGKAIFNIVKRSFSNSFEVVTPSLIAGVKGTVFRVVENGEEQAVSVFEGLVQVSEVGKTGEGVELMEQQMARLREGTLMGPLPVDPRDHGWEDWRPATVRQAVLQPPKENLVQNQESVRNTESAVQDSSDAALEDKEAWEAQRVLDRRNERLGDLLENSADFRREIQTGAIRSPSLTVEKIDEVVRSLTSTTDTTLGTDTTLPQTVDNTTTGLTGTLDNTVTGLTGLVDDTTSGLTETLDNTILDLPSLLP